MVGASRQRCYLKTSMEPKLTRHQVPRGTRPDAETSNAIYVIKNVSTLRATYQIRLLAFKSGQLRKKLVLKVPHKCVFHSALEELIDSTGKTIKRETL